MDTGTFLIVCINTSHPSGEFRYWLLSDEDDVAMTFETEEEANDYIEFIDNDNLPVAYKAVEV